jgi:transposase-like protein
MGMLLTISWCSELFKARLFDEEIVALNVRWYLIYKLSYRDLVA